MKKNLLYQRACGYFEITQSIKNVKLICMIRTQLGIGQVQTFEKGGLKYCRWCTSKRENILLLLLLLNGNLILEKRQIQFQQIYAELNLAWGSMAAPSAVGGARPWFFSGAPSPNLGLGAPEKNQGRALPSTLRLSSPLRSFLSYPPVRLRFGPAMFSPPPASFFPCFLAPSPKLGLGAPNP
uniref:Homing endonuclease n=1 Tax=Haematococcus lacustris TaxID=44745 RepID=A0A2K9YRW4_HAELA|nr:homing endonuclease [Haematococcus lacustris]AUW36506.1 homing endonuclease [Haematococcus lacustris]